MSKWKIENIEKKLKCKIRKNTFSIGFDVAEYQTGIYTLKTDATYIYSIGEKKLVVPKDKRLDINEKLNIFDGEITKVAQEIKSKLFKVAVIEDCHLQFNVWVLKLLARMETLVWKAVRDRVDYKFFKQAYHARLAVGFKKNPKSKKKIKEQVYDYIKETFNLSIPDNDIADGFVLAFVGLIKK